jgi:hypothetical protein
VRLFCIVDTLTITSMLPGIDDIINEVPDGNRPHGSRSRTQYVTFFRRHSSRIVRGVSAHVTVHREEIYDRVQAEKAQQVE